jgi:hypothetical protein
MLCFSRGLHAGEGSVPGSRRGPALPLPLPTKHRDVKAAGIWATPTHLDSVSSSRNWSPSPVTLTSSRRMRSAVAGTANRDSTQPLRVSNSSTHPLAATNSDRVVCGPRRVHEQRWRCEGALRRRSAGTAKSLLTQSDRLPRPSHEAAQTPTEATAKIIRQGSVRTVRDAGRVTRDAGALATGSLRLPKRSGPVSHQRRKLTGCRHTASTTCCGATSPVTTHWPQTTHRTGHTSDQLGEARTPRPRHARQASKRQEPWQG